MRRLRLSTLLVTINAGLLILAVAGVAVGAASLLRQLADDQAFARVEQAGVAAQNALRLAGHDAATSAQLLAERPTLRQLIVTGESEALDVFIRQFQITSNLDGVAVLVNEQVAASSGLTVDWAAMWREHAQDGSYFAHTTADGGMLLGAHAAVQEVPGAHTLVMVLLDDNFAGQLSGDIGLAVAFVPAAAAQGPDPLNQARGRALSSGEAVTLPIAEDGAARYVAVVPFGAPGAAPAGLVEAALPADVISEPVRQLTRGLLLLALLLGVVAAGINLALGRRLGRPLHSLTTAAARIGYGDLSTPVPAAPGAEAGTLAATLDEMRRRLLTLTADLRRQQAEAGAIVNGIVEGVFAVDGARRIQFINRQAAAMLGIAPADAIGRFCGDVLNPVGPRGGRPCDEDCPIVHARFQAATRATEHLRLAGGQQRTVVITSAPPSGEARNDGQLRQVQVMRDETELETSRRLRDTVLANISHEFRTPLTAQLASIELLLDQLPDLSREQVAELIVSLQQGALRLTHLIDNLLESVRIEAGQQSIRRQAVALDEVIENALELTQPLIAMRGQSVTLDLPYPCPPVCGDGPRLAQVFVNLLANANKFAPAGSGISVGGAVEAGSVSVWVEDQGPGLAQWPPDGLFARFDRLAGREPDAGGVGLGLSIVKSIVERHGGQVAAKSSQHGTRVTVTLPQMATDEDTRR
jgi:signal transduction histidine kinase/HAMP domain-containing protein